jgi:hypothetical protein
MSEDTCNFLHNVFCVRWCDQVEEDERRTCSMQAWENDNCLLNSVRNLKVRNHLRGPRVVLKFTSSKYYEVVDAFDLTVSG